MAEKSTKKFYISPKGKAASYSWINKADTKFKTQGEYKISLIIGEAEAQKLMAKIEQLHNDNYAASKADPKFKGKRLIEAALPFDIDEENGNVTFKFKMNASYLDKKSDEMKPLHCRVVDSQGERIAKAPAVGAGSELKVRFSMLPFAAVGGIGSGIKLQLDSVMLIKLIEFGQGGSTGKDENWSGEEEEGGFSKEAADKFDAEEPESCTDSDSDDDGDY